MTTRTCSPLSQCLMKWLHTRSHDHTRSLSSPQIDDYQHQQLTLTVFEDDLGWNDTKIGQGEVSFAEVVNSVQVGALAFAYSVV